MTIPPEQGTGDPLDDVPFDHRGRARPMYATAVPQASSTWRPGRLARLTLGLFPGVRVMAVSSAVAGIPYLLLGVAAVALGTLLFLDWDIANTNIRTFHIKKLFLLVHWGAIVLAVLVFELLRFASALEEKYYGTRAPRLLAALLMPAIIVLVGSPRVTYMWPQLMESVWLTAAVVAIGAVPAAIWSAAEGFLMSTDRLRRFQIVVVAGMGLTVGGGLGVIFAVANVRAAALAWTSNAGFEILPRLLGG